MLGFWDFGVLGWRYLLIPLMNISVLKELP